MNKIRIAFGYMAFPFAIASYFRHALEQRKDVELFTFGAYTGDRIPWGSGMRLPMRYVKPVDLPLPESITAPSWEMINDRLPWEPDLVICCDAGFHLSSKPNVPYAIILTDPHVLSGWYDVGNKYADYVFGMQRFYLKEGQVHLPYCASPDHHYPMNIQKDYDASLIGLHYEQRDRLVAALRERGIKVLYDLGLVYDEYREANNRAKIGLNWSSLKDINARFFETMAMKQVLLANRLPHIDELHYHEDEHYLGFDTVDEAVAKAGWVLAHPEEAERIAENGHKLVMQNDTYDHRIQTILETVGLL